jgi:hypothetical protein
LLLKLVQAHAFTSLRSGVCVRRPSRIVMAGLVPAIHEPFRGTKNVDARDKPGHDEFVQRGDAQGRLRRRKRER